jgi:imidazolonepropionase-like amidohydrolase
MKRLSTLAAVMLFAASLAQAETIAVVGGKVHTVGPQGIIESATVVATDGRITAVGPNVAVPEGATVIDAKGKTVTPGLFVSGVGFGLGEVGLSADPVDAGQSGGEFTASFDVADAFNPRATHIAVNRIEGITRAAIVPKPLAVYGQPATAHVISGLGAVVNLDDPGDNIDKRAAVLVVNLGAGGSALAGGSRATSLLILRRALDEANVYREDPDDYERGEFVHSARDLEALARVLDGETPLLAGIHRASDIEVLLRIVDEYAIEAVIAGGTEAWMLADELAVANVSVLLDPTANLPGNFDRLNARRGSASILVSAGVDVGFVGTGFPTHNARNITQLAGNAVADGLAWDDALRAITLTPAEIYGVDDAVGSIEVGKLADIVVWPGDPLELTNFPDAVIINGEAIDMVSRQTLLRDRYLQPGKPPAYRR